MYIFYKKIPKMKKKSQYHSKMIITIPTACSWEYCEDIRKHFTTEKLGWPKTRQPLPPPRNVFNIHARNKVSINTMRLNHPISVISICHV